MPGYSQQQQMHGYTPENSNDARSDASFQSVGMGNQAMQDQVRQRQAILEIVRGVAPESFEDSGLRSGVFAMALTAFQNAFEQGRSTSTTVTIIDYELPSKQKRLWVIDLREKQVLFHEHTAHGRGSDPNHDGILDTVSNQENSHQSNVGLLVTQETYTGRHGKSLRMDGLEEGFNDNARERAIVFHGSNYVNDEFIARHGKAGRSHGCPALDPDVSGQVIETIKDGTLVFAYHPNEKWLQNSSYLKE